MSPEEDRTRDAVDSEPKHYQGAIPAPKHPTNEETNKHMEGWSPSRPGIVLYVGNAGPPSVADARADDLSVCVCLSDRLVGLVVKASASRAEDLGFESRLRRDFFGIESYQ